jgi:hypothetical protein
MWVHSRIYRGGSPVDFLKANFSSQIKKHLFQTNFSLSYQTKNLTRGQRPNGAFEIKNLRLRGGSPVGFRYTSFSLWKYKDESSLGVQWTSGKRTLVRNSKNNYSDQALARHWNLTRDPKGRTVRRKTWNLKPETWNKPSHSSAQK